MSEEILTVLLCGLLLLVVLPDPAWGIGIGAAALGIRAAPGAYS